MGWASVFRTPEHSLEHLEKRVVKSSVCLIEFIAPAAVGMGEQGMEGQCEAEHHDEHEKAEPEQVEEHRPDDLFPGIRAKFRRSKRREARVGTKKE